MEAIARRCLLTGHGALGGFAVEPQCMAHLRLCRPEPSVVLVGIRHFISLLGQSDCSALRAKHHARYLYLVNGGAWIRQLGLRLNAPFAREVKPSSMSNPTGAAPRGLYPTNNQLLQSGNQCSQFG